MMSDVKKRLLRYVTVSVPIAGLIVSILSFVYFGLIYHQTSLAALAYISIPVVGGLLIALPFWILTYRFRKEQRSKNVKDAGVK